jgi:hypothetical protein
VRTNDSINRRIRSVWGGISLALFLHFNFRFHYRPQRNHFIKVLLDSLPEAQRFRQLLLHPAIHRPQSPAQDASLDYGSHLFRERRGVQYVCSAANAGWPSDTHQERIRIDNK